MYEVLLKVKSTIGISHNKKDVDNAIEASLSEDDKQYDIQDCISATDHVTELTAVAQIVKKIAVLENGQVTISYEVR